MARFLSDVRGAAAVEFALAATFVFLALLPFVDYAIYASDRKDLQEAVYRATLYAVGNPDAVDAETLTRYINAGRGEGSTPLTVSIQCNGAECSTANRASLCLGGTTSTPVFSSPAGGSCTGGDAPGYFITIAAHTTYNALIGSASSLQGETVSAKLTARLQ